MQLPSIERKVLLPLLCVLFILGTLPMQGQDSNNACCYQADIHAFKCEMQPEMFRTGPCDTMQAQRLYFDLDVTSFFRNAEYAMPFTVGFTSINYRLTPNLTYTINDRATFSAGFQFDGIVGSDSLIRFFPIFRFEYQATSWSRLILGSIYGGLNHGLEWPLYDYERNFFSYYYHPEAGVQILTTTHRWHSDTWLDWEHYLNPWTYDQERFTAATRHEFLWLQKDAEALEMKHCVNPQHFKILQALTLSSPFTVLVAHRGGQSSLIDTNSGSILNMQVGLAAKSFLNTAGSSLRAYLPIFYYRDISGSDDRYNATETYHSSFRDGWGIYPQITWHQVLKNDNHSNNLCEHNSFSFADNQPNDVLDITLAYWHGQQYLSPRGSLLYQSNTWKSDTTYPVRNMLTLNATFEHYYKGVALGLDMQLFYDLHLHKADYAYGIYLRWDLRRTLKKL
jgi:hypothetical protein